MRETSGTRRAERLRAQGHEERAARVEKGNEGEAYVSSLLHAGLPTGWVVLEDRRASPDSPRNLDHLVVGPPGVFVIDTKNWAGGLLRLDARGMRVGGWRKDDELHRAKVDASVVAGHLDRSVLVHAVLAFVQDVGLPGGGKRHHDVVLLQADELCASLLGLPHVLSPDEVAVLAGHLATVLPPRVRSDPRLTVRAEPAVRAGTGAVRPAPRRPGRHAARTRSRWARAARAAAPALFVPAVIIAFPHAVEVLPPLLSSVLGQAMERVVPASTPTP